MMRRYLIYYILSLLLLLIIVASINFVVDPDGRFRVIDRADFNQIKINPSPGSRQGKAIALQQCDYATVILGSSRAETGLDPDSEVFVDQPVYNAALKGTSMREILSIGEFVLHTQKPKIIIFGVDFLTFSKQRDTAADFLDSVLHNDPTLLSVANYLLSTDTLLASWYTASWNIAGYVRRCHDNGHNDRSGDMVNQREAFDAIQTTYIRNQGLYGKHEINREYLDKFASLLQMIVERDIELLIFISPMHALQIELLQDAKLLESFRNWKRDLVKIVATTNAALPSAKHIELWDFSGYNSITMEPVPPAGSEHQMRWYRDSAHYRIATGDLILQKLLDRNTSDLPIDFGVQLTPESIETVLAAESQNATKYRTAEASEVANTRRLAAEARKLPPINTE